MALNIDLDGFGFLSDSDVSKLSPSLKQQPPISPIESESSSGISSLDSEDFFKKQLLSSPTISHDDDEQQSDSSVMAVTKDEEDDEKDSERSTTDEEEEEEEEEDNGKEEVRAETTDEKKEIEKEEEKRFETKQVAVVYEEPPKVVYQNRDVLDLGRNLRGFGPLVQFTVLPENNVNCFFQNRAQYWRLSSGERQEYSLEKCPCCDFTYPSTQQPLNQGPKPIAKNANAVTESLLTFLKSTEPMQPISPIKRSVNYQQYGGYPMQQQQQQSPPQQYQSNNNGFYNNNINNNSNFTGNYANQQMNSFMNNNTGYGTTLALLNLMNNASRNAASAFQAMSSTNTNRFYNNINNGYKQF